MKLKHLLFIPTLLIVSCNNSSSTYKVTFDANGGTFTSGTTIKISVKANKPVNKVDEIPSHDKDYLFGQWYDNKACIGEAFDFSTPIKHDMTLYANWHNNTGPDTDRDGLADSIDPAPEDNTYTADLLEIYPPIHRVEMPITIDYDEIYKGCCDINYYKDLEKLCNVCAMDIYKESTTTLDGPSTIYEPVVGDDDEELYLQLGCTDIKSYTLDPKDYPIDKFDTYRCILAHHHVFVGRDQVEVLFISNQGTDSEAEWFSDFDVGEYSDNYAHVTDVAIGDHTDWINNGQSGKPLHHKGFDVAANRELEKVIKPYIKKYIGNKYPFVIVNTGHSRGAAIANLLHPLIKKTHFEQFNGCATYTFATPTTVYNSEKKNVAADTLYNILNGDDLVPQLPLKSWDYYRYGEDKVASVSDGHEIEWKKYNNTIFPYEYPDSEKLIGEMSGMAPTIHEVYDKTSHTKFFETECDSLEECEKIKEEWRTKADYWYGRNTLDFLPSEDINNTMIVEGYNRPVSLMYRLAVVLGNVNEGNLERLYQMIGDGCLCPDYQEIEDDFLLNGAALLTAHRGVTYYFISEKLINA